MNRKAIGGLFFAAFAATFIWSGYVFAVLWGWFIAPVFEVPSLSVPAAFGVALVAHFLAPNNRIRNSFIGEDWINDAAQGLAFVIFKSLTALAVGYLVKQWL